MKAGQHKLSRQGFGKFNINPASSAPEICGVRLDTKATWEHFLWIRHCSEGFTRRTHLYKSHHHHKRWVQPLTSFWMKLNSLGEVCRWQSLDFCWDTLALEHITLSHCAEVGCLVVSLVCLQTLQEALKKLPEQLSPFCFSFTLKWLHSKYVWIKRLTFSTWHPDTESCWRCHKARLSHWV